MRKIERYNGKNLDDYQIEWHDFGNGVKFPHVPKDEPWKIGVKMSGGIDSGTIMYVLAWLRDQGKLHPNTELFAMTGVNWVRPYQTEYVNKTIDYINNKFNCNIPYTVTLTGNEPGGPDLEDATEKCVTDAYESLGLHINYTGRSKFLPVEYIDNTEYKDTCCDGIHDENTKEFSYKIMLDLEHKDNFKYNWDKDMHTRLWGTKEETVVEAGAIHPWRNMHKAHVKVVTDALGISDDLLTLTRSCEHFERNEEQWLDFSFHCGECYWCVERLVTYGKLQ